MNVRAQEVLLSDGVSSVENPALEFRKDPKIGVFLVSKYQIVLAALRYLLPSSPDIEIVGEAEGTLQLASDAIRKQKPNVVLLDMPEEGNSAIRLVTEIKNTAGSAIVILVVDDSPRLVRAILMSGVKGYVLPMKALAVLSTLQSADIVLPTTDGREIRLRRITEPTAEQKSLLHQLGLSLPERLKSLSKCSADFATA
jgi:DNA-binding NarL/FixJ family response regulator